MPVSFSRSWMNMSNSCCLRVSIAALPMVRPLRRARIIAKNKT